MKRKILEGTAVGLLAAIISSLIWAAGLLDRWEFVTWAWRAQYFAKPGPNTAKIKLILLDQASLDWGSKEMGWPWPWPRQVYAPIIDFCRRSGARAIVFDVLYTEPSTWDVADDRLLGEAIGRAPFFVVPLQLHRGSDPSSAVPNDMPDRVRIQFEGLREWWTTAGSGVAMSSATFPIEEVASNATILANAVEDSDLDGIFRRTHLFWLLEDRVIPSVGLAAFLAKDTLGEEGPDRKFTVEGKIDRDTLQIHGKNIPMDSEGRLILRFRGGSEAFQTFNAAEVIRSERLIQSGEAPSVAPDAFKDSYVLFGFSAPGLLDLRPSPVSRNTPGVAIHATMLDNLLSGDFLRELRPVYTLLSTFLLALLCAISTVLLGRKAWHQAAAFVVFTPAPVLAGFAAYPLGIWWPVAVQGGAVVLSLVGAVSLNYATEGRKKAFIKNVFRHYLSPAVIEQILQNPDRLKLGGELRELTIFFSDLQGFSSFSEKLDPETLTSLLNEYLTDMTDIILEEGGTLDKYEGDAIIAFWNAPADQPDHAERACRTALRCQRKLAERRGEFLKRTGISIHMRIGLNTGNVVVGNMGSKQRFDYTVLGDAANLASRLEGANKAFGTFTMVSEETWLRAKDTLRGRELGLIRVVGRKTPVRVFEPTGFSGEAEPAALKEFERGLMLCYENNWEEALARFETLDHDPAAAVYAARCRTLVGDPAASWDAIWRLDEK